MTSDTFEWPISDMPSPRVVGPVDIPDKSLQMLAPHAWVPRDKKQSSSSTTLRLEHMSKSIIEAFCNQDWWHPVLNSAVPNFHAFIDSVEVRTKGLEQQVEFHKWMHTKMNPGYAYEAVQVSADVDEEKGLATAWVTLRVTGHPLKIQRESVTVLYWRRRPSGEWQTHKQSGIRGGGWAF